MSELAARLWEHVLALAQDAPSLQSAARQYLKQLSALSTARSGVLDAALKRALADLEERRGAGDLDELLAGLAFNHAERGHGAAAQAAAQKISAVETQERTNSQIALFAYFHGLADRTPVEQALMDIAEEKGVAALVVQALRRGDDEIALGGLVGQFKELRVRLQLFDWAPHLVATVVQHWGAPAGKAVVDAVTEFDRRLIAAAARAVRQNGS